MLLAERKVAAWLRWQGVLKRGIWQFIVVSFGCPWSTHGVLCWYVVGSFWNCFSSSVVHLVVLSADGAPQLSRRGSAALAGPDLFHNADADCNENYNQLSRGAPVSKLLSSHANAALSPLRTGSREHYLTTI